MNNKIYSMMMVYLIVVSLFPVEVVGETAGSETSNIAGEVPKEEKKSPDELFQEKAKNNPEQITTEELDKYLQGSGSKDAIPWEKLNWKEINDGIVPAEYVNKIPASQVDVNEVKFVEKLTAEQLSAGTNLDLLSNPPKLTSLNRAELTKAIQDKAKFAKNLDLSGLTAGATFDTTTGKLSNGKNSVVLSSLTDPKIIGVTASVDGALEIVYEKEKSLRIVNGNIIGDAQGNFDIIPTSDGVVIDAVGVRANIKIGAENIVIKPGGFYADKNGKITADKVIATLAGDYFDGSFDKNGNEIHLKRGFHIDLDTGVGTKGGDIKIHKDQLSGASRFVPKISDEQKKEAVDKAMKELSKAPDSSGEVWIKKENEKVNVYARGNVDVRFYDKDTKQQKNDLVFSSNDPNGVLDFQHEGTTVDFDAKGSVHVSKGQKYGDVDVNAVTYDGHLSEAKLTYSNKGEENLVITCPECKTIGDIASLKRGFVQQSVDGKLVAEELGFKIGPLRNPDGTHSMHATLDALSLMRIASRNVDASSVQISQDFRLKVNDLDITMAKNGDIQAEITDENGDVKNVQYSFIRSKAELGSEPAIIVEMKNSLSKAEMDAMISVEEQRSVTADIGKKFSENKKLVAEYEKAINEGKKAIVELSAEKANSWFGLSSEAEEVLRGLQDSLKNVQKDLDAERAKQAELLGNARKSTGVVKENYQKVIQELEALKITNPSLVASIDKEISNVQGNILISDLEFAATSDDYDRVHEIVIALRDKHPEHHDRMTFLQGLTLMKQADDFPHDSDAYIKKAYFQLSQAAKNPEFKQEADVMLQKLDGQMLTQVHTAIASERGGVSKKFDEKYFGLLNRFNPLKQIMILTGTDNPFTGAGGSNTKTDRAVAVEITKLGEQERGILFIRMLRERGVTFDEISRMNMYDVQKTLGLPKDDLETARNFENDMNKALSNPDVKKLVQFSKEKEVVTAPAAGFDEKLFGEFKFESGKGYAREDIDNLYRWTDKGRLGSFTIPIVGAEVDVAEQIVELTNPINLATMLVAGPLIKFAGSGLMSGARSVGVFLTTAESPVAKALVSAGAKIAASTTGRGLYTAGTVAGKAVAAPLAATEKLGEMGLAGKVVGFVGEEVVFETGAGIVVQKGTEVALRVGGADAATAQAISGFIGQVTEIAIGSRGPDIQTRNALEQSAGKGLKNAAIDDIAKRTGLPRAQVEEAAKNINLEYENGVPKVAEFRQAFDSATEKANIKGKLSDDFHNTVQIKVPAKDLETTSNAASQLEADMSGKVPEVPLMSERDAAIERLNNLKSLEEYAKQSPMVSSKVPAIQAEIANIEKKIKELSKAPAVSPAPNALRKNSVDPNIDITPTIDSTSKKINEFETLIKAKDDEISRIMKHREKVRELLPERAGQYRKTALLAYENKLIHERNSLEDLQTQLKKDLDALQSGTKQIIQEAPKKPVSEAATQPSVVKQGEPVVEDTTRITQGEEAQKAFTEAIAKGAEIKVENPNTKIDFEALEKIGVEPKTRVVVDGVPFYFSDKIKSPAGRDLVVGYVEIEGKLHVRAFYTSTSHSNVRSISHLPRQDGAIMLYGKGLAEESTNLPFELTPVVKNLPYTKSTQEQIDFFHNSILTDKMDKDWGKIAVNGKDILKKEFLDHRAKYPLIDPDPKKIVLEDPLDGPDFHHKPKIDTIEHINYGTLTREIYPSKNGKNKWLILKDKDNRVMFGGSEVVGSKIKKVGVPSEYVSIKELDSPIIEHKSQIGQNYRGGLDPTGEYADNTRFIERIPLIQEYRAVRGIPRPEKDIFTGQKYDWSDLPAQSSVSKQSAIQEPSSPFAAQEKLEIPSNIRELNRKLAAQENVVTELKSDIEELRGQGTTNIPALEAKISKVQQKLAEETASLNRLKADRDKLLTELESPVSESPVEAQGPKARAFTEQEGQMFDAQIAFSREAKNIYNNRKQKILDDLKKRINAAPEGSPMQRQIEKDLEDANKAFKDFEKANPDFVTKNLPADMPAFKPVDKISAGEIDTELNDVKNRINKFKAKNKERLNELAEERGPSDVAAIVKDANLRAELNLLQKRETALVNRKLQLEDSTPKAPSLGREAIVIEKRYETMNREEIRRLSGDERIAAHANLNNQKNSLEAELKDRPALKKQLRLDGLADTAVDKKITEMEFELNRINNNLRELEITEPKESGSNIFTQAFRASEKFKTTERRAIRDMAAAAYHHGEQIKNVPQVSFWGGLFSFVKGKRAVAQVEKPLLFGPIPMPAVRTVPTSAAVIDIPSSSLIEQRTIAILDPEAVKEPIIVKYIIEDPAFESSVADLKPEDNVPTTAIIIILSAKGALSEQDVPSEEVENTVRIYDYYARTYENDKNKDLKKSKIIEIVPIDVDVNIEVNNDQDVKLVLNKIKTNADELFKKIGAGTRISKDAFQQQICKVEGVTKCSLNEPFYDIVLLDNEVARLGTFT